MTARQLTVVDVETSGLRPGYDVAVEVAWWNLGTGEQGRFVPLHDVARVLRIGDPRALELNGYRERLAAEPQDEGGVLAAQLAKMLNGNTFAGSNPAFDVSFLTPVYGVDIPCWHHRLLDLSAYAAGVLHIPPTELPGLAAVCERLDIENTAPHTAEGDVDATGRCFLALTDPAGGAS